MSCILFLATSTGTGSYRRTKRRCYISYMTANNQHTGTQAYYACWILARGRLRHN